LNEGLPPSAAAVQIGPLDFGTSLSSLIEHFGDDPGEAAGRLRIDLRPFMNPAPYAVQEVCPMARVYRLFRGMGIRHLVVVDETNVVQGIMTRHELQTHFTEGLY